MPRFVIGALLTALLAYPMLFYAHKYAVPWSGLTDFRSYHAMVLQPLDFQVARAPFAMRQVPTLIARLILDLGLIYPNEIWFDHFTVYQGVTYRKDVFFALMFGSFLGMVGTGGLLYMAASRLDAGQARLLSPYGLLAVALLLLAGTTLFYTVAPLTEGWSWFLLTEIFILSRRDDRWRWLALPLLMLAIFERELLPLVIAILATAELLARGREAGSDRRRYLLALLGTSLLALLTYWLLRGVVLPVWEIDGRQISPAFWIRFLIVNWRRFVQFEFIQGVFFKLNVFLLWSAAAVLALRRGLPRWDTVFLAALAASAAAILLIAVGSAGDRGSDRLVAIVTPLFVLSAVELLHRLNQPDPPRG